MCQIADDCALSSIALSALCAFARQPLSREVDCWTLRQQYAWRGADPASFHQACLCKGRADCGELVSIHKVIIRGIKCTNRSTSSASEENPLTASGFRFIIMS